MTGDRKKFRSFCFFRLRLNDSATLFDGFAVVIWNANAFVICTTLLCVIFLAAQGVICLPSRR